MKETKKFFGLDECDEQMKLWEERRRRHACRSNGPLKNQCAQRTPGIPSFKDAAQVVVDTPLPESAEPSSRSFKPPALLSVCEEAKKHSSESSRSAAIKNKMGLKVDVDSVRQASAELTPQTLGTSSAGSFQLSEVASVSSFIVKFVMILILSHDFF